MATILFKGDPGKGGIPYKANVRIETMAAMGNNKITRRLIYTGKVSDSLSIDLDPGKYVYSVTKLLPAGEPDNCCYVGSFMHEVDEKTWKLIQFMQPTMVRALHTTDGVRWNCLFPACKRESTSSLGALLHEVGHFGMSREEFLANPKGLHAREVRIQADTTHKKIASEKAARGAKGPLGGKLAKGPRG